MFALDNGIEPFNKGQKTWFGCVCVCAVHSLSIYRFELRHAMTTNYGCWHVQRHPSLWLANWLVGSLTNRFTHSPTVCMSTVCVCIAQASPQIFGKFNLQYIQFTYLSLFGIGFSYVFVFLFRGAHRNVWEHLSVANNTRARSNFKRLTNNRHRANSHILNS